MTTDGQLKRIVKEHIRQTRKLHAMVHFLLPFIVFMSLSSDKNYVYQVAWMIMLWINGIGLSYFTQFKNENDESGDNFIVLLFLIYGVLWGSSGLIFDDGSDVKMAFLSIICVGLISALIIIGVYWIALFYAVSIPILILFVLKIVINFDVSYIWLMILFMIYLRALIINISKQKEMVVMGIKMQQENEELIRELKIQKDAAIEANSNKTRFLAAASHDLRQPLHAVGLFCSTLSSKIDNADQIELVEGIKNAVNSLDLYLASLLDISKLDAGVIQPVIRKFNLKDNLECICAEYALQSESKGLLWDMQLQDGFVESDETFVEIILRNLLSNAIRYTHEGGISVKMELHENELTVHIMDTGIGIDPSYHQVIFDEFRQLNNPERDNKKGVGLGLAMVKRLCHFLNMDISVASELGKGSVFSLRMPCANSLADLSSPVGSTVITPEIRCINILMLENHTEVRLASIRLLEDWGHRVYAVHSLQEALEIVLDGFRPDVIISDFGISPDFNGIQAITRLKQKLDQLVIGIVVTGESSPAIRKQLDQCEYRVLYKPVKPLKLRGVLISAIKELEQLTA